jgi:hypothetical protein
VTCNLDVHIARAVAVRFEANFVKVPAPELVGLIDCIIACARAGVTLTEADRDGLKPFCGAADAHAQNRGPVILRCEDYYHLVELAKRVNAARADLSPPNTTRPPWTTPPADLPAVDFLPDAPPADLPAVDFLPDAPPETATAAADLEPLEQAALAETQPKKLRRKKDQVDPDN